MSGLFFVLLGGLSFWLTGVLMKHFRRRYMTNWKTIWSILVGFALVSSIGVISGWAFDRAGWGGRWWSISLTLYALAHWKAGGESKKANMTVDILAFAAAAVGLVGEVVIHQTGPWG